MNTNLCLDLFNQWNQALLEGAEKVSSLYHDDAILIPTVKGDKIYSGHQQYVEYFEEFCAKNPHAIIEDAKIQEYSENSYGYFGHYKFTFEDTSQVHARFSFIFSKKNGQWKISHHHSSFNPSLS